MEVQNRKVRIFQINNLIKLKLENDETVIYIGDNQFRQCKILLLEIPVEDVKDYERIESIDEIALESDNNNNNNNNNIYQASLTMWQIIQTLTHWQLLPFSF